MRVRVKVWIVIRVKERVRVMTRIRMKSLHVNVVRGCVARVNVAGGDVGEPYFISV
jgi:hypothetical protein